ncbi:YkvA family protein [Cryobacterium sp. MDB1-18-1]|uniref:YkvA family protein n=1 Tax=Cryobacterium sp. MDB1-18-1 TaxID=1259168 RepID=UPI001F5416B5|nr:YkvA family protein [Cryobacterium sp. MDB1-18-1]
MSPIDLVPDFIPGLGYTDDAILLAIALQFATRRAGNVAVQQHWPETPERLSAVHRLAGLRSSTQ